MRFGKFAHAGLLLLGLASAFPQPYSSLERRGDLRSRQDAEFPDRAMDPDLFEEFEEDEEDVCSPETCGDACKRSLGSDEVQSFFNEPFSLDTSITKRAIDSPSRGALDAWVVQSLKELGRNELDITATTTWPGDDTRIERDFGEKPFKMGMKGLFGCTAIVVTGSKSAYMSHHWEHLFRYGEGDTKDGDIEDDFYREVLYSLDCLSCKYNKETDKEVRVTIFTKANVGSKDQPLRAPKSVKKVIKKLKVVIKGLKDSDITVVPYSAPKESANSDASAKGKLILSYNPKASPGKAGYELWGAGLINDNFDASLQPEDINKPISKHQWKRDSDSSSGKGGNGNGNGKGNAKRQSVDLRAFQRQQAQWTRDGMCRNYLDEQNPDRNPLDNCSTYCDKQEGGRADSAMCPGKLEEDLGLADVIQYDPEGYRFTMALCDCDLEMVEVIGGVLFDALEEGLSQLGSIICGTFLSAIDTVIDIGVSAIPGVGPAYRATKQAVRAAKTVAENGLGASEYKNWVGAACNLKNWDFDIMDAFFPLTDAPDDTYGDSLGCFRKGGDKKKCKEGKKKGDDGTKTTTKDPGPITTTTSKDGTTTSGTTTTSATETATECPKTRKAKFGIQ